MSKHNGGRPKVAVVGMGNLLLKDEGIGVHVVQELQNRPLPQDIDLEIIDGGTSPDTLYMLEDVDKLIIVDAVQGGSEPGAVYRFSPDQVDLEPRLVTSVHQISLIEGLRLMRQSGREPEETVIIGVEPAEIGWGLELTPQLARRLPQIIEVVLKEIDTEREEV